MSESYKHLLVEKKDDVTTVKLNAETPDSGGFEDVGDELFNVLEKEGCTKLVVNLGNVEYLQSIALGKFVSLEKRLAEKGGDLRLCNLQPAVHELFEITGLLDVIDIRQDEDAALRDF